MSSPSADPVVSAATMTGMFNIIPLIVTVLLAASPNQRFGLSEPMPRLDGTIRLASYNVLNFFDQTDDPRLQGEYDDFGDNPGPTTDERCRTLADVIRAVDADVLALQEVESKEAITWFRDNYLADMGYDYIASEDVGYYRGVEQSLLSRFPIRDVKTWTSANLDRVKRVGGGWDEVPDDKTNIRFQRSPLCATVKTPEGYELTLFVMHHKSGRSRWHREAEALQVMEYVAAMLKKDPDRNIAILGDFNAQPWDRSMQVYLRGGMIDSMTCRNHNLDHGDASPVCKTHTSDRLIDFILLNHGATGELVTGSGFVLGTSAEEYDWRNNPIPPGYASDHYPIAVDLVPVDGAGSTVESEAWPRSAMGNALKGYRPKATTSGSASSSSSKSSSQASVDGEFVASARSKVFHKADCHNAKKISKKNIVKYDSSGKAENDGRRLAGCCKSGS